MLTMTKNFSNLVNIHYVKICSWSVNFGEFTKYIVKSPWYDCFNDATNYTGLDLLLGV